MLLIRRQQMQAMEAVAHAQLIGDLVEHTRHFFPNHYRIFGEQIIRSVIFYCLERSRAHGIYTERGIFTYFTLMLMLGSNFDIDIQLPWAAETLQQRELDQRERIQRLTEQAEAYFGLIAGPGQIAWIRAILRLRRRLIDILELTYLHQSDLDSYILAQCTRLFPNKVTVVGTHYVGLTIQSSFNLALRHRMGTQRGRALLSILAFFLGSGFDGDPQFEPILAVLRKPSDESPDAKVNQLLQILMDYIDRWHFSGHFSGTIRTFHGS